MHKQTARRKSLQHEGLLQSASHQTKLWIEAALKKANTAVKHDTLNDFGNAIFYYTDAVDLLNKVLENSKEKNEEMDGLEAICNIYMERIDFLSYFMRTDTVKNEDITKDTFSNIDDKIRTPSPSRSPKQEYFNSVFLNMFSKRRNKKEGSHHPHSSKHKNQYPKASKSTPTNIPESSLWKLQIKSKSHHVSSDGGLDSRVSSLSSSSSGSTDALCIPLKGHKNGHGKSRNCLPLGKDHHNKSLERRDLNQEDRAVPTLPRRNCNRNSPSGISCCLNESIENFNKKTSNPCLKIPTKSSQRRPNSSLETIGKHIPKPVRDSSLSHVNSWRARNSPSSASNSYEFSNTDIPNGLERKADYSRRKGVSPSEYLDL